MSIALSTRWLDLRARSADSILEALRALDVRGYALARGLPAPDPAAIDGVLKPAGASAVAVEAGATAHGDAAADDGVGSAISPDANERAVAMLALRRAVQLAKDAACPLVIVRLGDAKVLRARERDMEIRALVRANGATAEAKTAAASAQQDVRRHLEPYLERTCRVLFDLCRAEPEMTFAVATPSSPFGLIPFGVLPLVFSELRGKRVGYWHDSGAARMQEQLDLAPPDAWAGEHAPHAVGASLHDVAGGEAFLPPGSGEIDFRRLRDALPSGIPCVVEAQPRFQLRELRHAVSLLRTSGY